LAENYLADKIYSIGTVMAVGGSAEVTACQPGDRAIGVVSDKPAYLMNEGLVGGTAIALKGRVPVRIVGTVNKGDRLVASDIPGTAQRLDPDQYQPACIVGKALEAHNSDQIGTIEVAVGRT
jgi:hypothetical protein